MKKVIIVLLLAFLVSCEKNESKTTYYDVSFKVEKIENNIAYLTSIDNSDMTNKINVEKYKEIQKGDTIIVTRDELFPKKVIQIVKKNEQIK